MGFASPPSIGNPAAACQPRPVICVAFAPRVSRSTPAGLRAIVAEKARTGTAVDPGSRPSDEDIALFRESVGTVRPLRRDAVAIERPRPEPIPEQARLEIRRVLQESLAQGPEIAEVETGEELLYSAPGVGREVLRRLRRGQLSMQEKLDLHGMSVPEAREAVARFLNGCKSRGLRSVLIIHGKGLGSHQKRPVLKGKLNLWLTRRAEVLAFCSARAVDGGTGAVYVLLRA